MMRRDPLLGRLALDKARRRAERVALLRVMGGAPRPFWAPCTDYPMVVLVHRDTYEATLGRWRITRFDELGPTGHDVFKSWGEAVECAQQTWHVDMLLARDPRVDPQWST